MDPPSTRLHPGLQHRMAAPDGPGHGRTRYLYLPYLCPAPPRAGTYSASSALVSAPDPLPSRPSRGPVLIGTTHAALPARDPYPGTCPPPPAAPRLDPRYRRTPRTSPPSSIHLASALLSLSPSSTSLCLSALSLRESQRAGWSSIPASGCLALPRFVLCRRLPPRPIPLPPFSSPPSPLPFILSSILPLSFFSSLLSLSLFSPFPLSSLLSSPLAVCSSPALVVRRPLRWLLSSELLYSFLPGPLSFLSTSIFVLHLILSLPLQLFSTLSPFLSKPTPVQPRALAAKRAHSLPPSALDPIYPPSSSLHKSAV
ncbi:hypothetical protein CDD83_7981 [Cordyceps sp. RAO-2017]|nr:hypothetical protein CDD83_7981 [Cordyceps sp. RAO-2017]